MVASTVANTMDEREDVPLTPQELKPLIDCDIIVYRCGFAADAQVRRELQQQDPSAPKEEVEEAQDERDYLHFALGNVKEVMEEITHYFTQDYRAFLTGTGNFREQLATILPYKGNRDPTHKPKYYNEIKEYLKNVWNAEIVHGREADDAIGCAHWAAKDRDTVIVTIDKDLDMLPGYHYNWVKNQFYNMPLRKANLFLFWQMMVGDTTDNIPGIRGIGPKGADRVILANNEELRRVQQAVRAMYNQQYGYELGPLAYNEVADLLWIQRIEGQECPFK